MTVGENIKKFRLLKSYTENECERKDYILLGGWED